MLEKTKLCELIFFVIARKMLIFISKFILNVLLWKIREMNKIKKNNNFFKKKLEESVKREKILVS